LIGANLTGATLIGATLTNAVFYENTITSASGSILTDSSANWTTNEWSSSYSVCLTNTPCYTIQSNTSTTITISSTFPLTYPGTTVYSILHN
jgi:uncharacterized protein YjbI with pentapeptide repeats